jgi:hypothetical protein
MWERFCRKILDNWNIIRKKGFKGAEECYYNKNLDFPNKLPLEKQYIPDRKRNHYNQFIKGNKKPPSWLGYDY